MVVSLIEKFGIGISVAFGEHKYAKVKEIFTKLGIVCCIIMAFVTTPLFVFSDSILRSEGFDSSISIKVQTLTRMSIPLILINFLSEYIKSICLSQGHEKIFGYISAFFLVLTIGANYLLIVKLRMGIKGWILTRTAYEFASLLVALYAYRRIRPETKGFVRLGTALIDFAEFFF